MARSGDRGGGPVGGQVRLPPLLQPRPDLARHGLAAAYEAAGRTAEALAAYEEVAARFEAVMGPEQTLTRTARADVERVRGQLW